MDAWTVTVACVPGSPSPPPLTHEPPASIPLPSPPDSSLGAGQEQPCFFARAVPFRWICKPSVSVLLSRSFPEAFSGLPAPPPRPCNHNRSREGSHFVQLCWMAVFPNPPKYHVIWLIPYLLYSSFLVGFQTEPRWRFTGGAWTRACWPRPDWPKQDLQETGSFFSFFVCLNLPRLLAQSLKSSVNSKKEQ